MNIIHEGAHFGEISIQNKNVDTIRIYYCFTRSWKGKP